VRHHAVDWVVQGYSHRLKRLSRFESMPKSIADLLQHNCIGMRDAVSGEVFEWELTEGKKTITIKLPGTALVRHTMEALSLALAGVGVVYVLEPLARP
jgi:hypothetical protein